MEKTPYQSMTSTRWCSTFHDPFPPIPTPSSCQFGGLSISTQLLTLTNSRSTSCSSLWMCMPSRKSLWSVLTSYIIMSVPSHVCYLSKVEASVLQEVLVEGPDQVYNATIRPWATFVYRTMSDTLSTEARTLAR